MKTIADLRFDDKNFNRHTAYGMSLLEKSLRENGAGRSILLDKDNNIIAGNGIIEAAGSVGLENVKIVETQGDEIVAVKRTDVSLNSKQGRKMALADNATAKADIEWDAENLKSEFDDATLKEWVGEQDWLDNEPDEVVEDEAPEVNESEPADSELGKVYKLGEHRLMCGDSTDAGSVAILMDGEKADIAFTSPPYGAGGVSKLRDHYVRGKEKIKSFYNTHNDDINNWENLISSSLDNMFENSVDIFINVQMIADNKKILWRIINDRIDNLCDIIIWDKHRAAPQMQDNVLNNRFEFIFYMSSSNKSRAFSFGDFHGIYSNVIDDVSLEQNEYASIHKAVFPVGLPAKILNMNMKASSVLELFGGTGSTLIACEQLGRRCYMMELDPKYCDVIRKRYWKLKTGSEEGWQDGTPAI